MSVQSIKTKGLIFVGCTLALCFFLAAPLLAQDSDLVCDDLRFFPETNHGVCDRFLEFFDSRGGLEIFGYPITEQFYQNGRLVQYFQRVRMEYHPELSPRYQVQLGLLGDFLAPLEAKASIAESERPKSNDRQHRYFSETGHTVGFGFLKFFDKNGGLDVFGYPITEFMVENGRGVQYFQRALMEWDPNQGGVVLHDLGSIWLDQNEALRVFRDGSRSNTILPEPIPVDSTVTALHVSAFVRNAFSGLAGEQTVWVYVSDQNGRPVEGAQVTLVASFLSGNSFLLLPTTDDLGHTEKTFLIDGLTPGQLAIIDVKVDYRGVNHQIQAFFFAWW